MKVLGSLFLLSALVGLVALSLMARRRLRSAQTGAFRRLPAGARLSRFIPPYRVPLVLGTALTLVETILGLASAWPLKFVVDNAIGGRPLPGWLGPLDGLSPTSLTLAAAGAGIALVATSGLVGYLSAYLMGAAAERIGGDLRVAAFRRLQELSLRFHDRNRTGDLITRLISDVSRVQDALVAWFRILVPEGLALLGMLVVIFAIDVQLALAALVVVPVLGAFVLRTRPRIKRAHRLARTRSGRLAAHATEVLRNVRAVQAFGRQAHEVERFARDSEEAATSAVVALDVSARLSPVADIVLAMGTGLVLWLGVMRVTAGRMTLGTLLVVLAYLSSLYGPIRSLSRLATMLSKGAASRERLTEIFAEEDALPEDPASIAAPLGPYPIAFHHVTFAYTEGTPVLRDVSFEIQPGEIVCIVGPTGAGKTTLLALMLRFYDPDGGSVGLGGTDLRRLTIESVRDRVAIVPQDGWILDGTIAENITFGRAGATEQEVRDVGSRALVEEFAARLPNGYDTVVGEGGAQLSGGQRRRIALARALLRDAPILLLDEPTSGLDAASEVLVLEALRASSSGRTVVMVSHRLQVSEMADRVIVLVSGMVVEDGPPPSLLAGNGMYAHLYEVQNATARGVHDGDGGPVLAAPRGSSERR